MSIAYFDCFSGISGDMLLGALIDAGADLRLLQRQLQRLWLSGWTMSAEKVVRCGIAATQVKVAAPEEHAHRSLSEILNLIERSGLAARVQQHAAAIFRRLGEVEAKIHAIPLERVHFHEVGAMDSIIDIVGAAIGFELLGIDHFACSALNLGSGCVQAAHGPLPVPAPATAELLRGLPVYSTGIELELVTPTGAAIVSTLCSQFAILPQMRVAAIGYGAGAADPRSQANVLRLMVGEPLPVSAGVSEEGWDEEITVVEANLDDMSPQIHGYFVDQALAAGALEVFLTPVQMKKNRPGQLLTVLCRPPAAGAMSSLIFRETTTIGVRSYRAQRRTLARETVSVETPLGPVRVKVSRLNGSILNAAPEYEDCRRIAAEKNIPLKQVLSEAAYYFQKAAKSQAPE